MSDLHKYSYGEITHQSNDMWNKTLLCQKAKLELNLLSPFNSVLINRYNDQQQGIPFHQDNESCLGVNPVISSITVSDAGRMVVKNKAGKFIEVQLYPGTLLVMGGTFNSLYYHQVCRASTKNDYRFNLTYRYIRNASSLTDSVKNSSTTFHQTHDELSKKVDYLTALIKERNKHYDSETKLQQSPPNLKVVLLGNEVPDTLSIESVTKKINEHLSVDAAIKPEELCNIQDHREKKGPVIIELKNLPCKVRLLKSIKCTKKFLLRIAFLNSQL